MKNVASLLLVLVLFFSNGCIPIPVIVTAPLPPPRETPRNSYSAIQIPKGHMPPPGHCRIWYPDKPAGHQPPPQRCPIPLNQIPLGAYVVSRVNGDDKQAMVKIYDQRRPGIVASTQYVAVH